jgi:hypothetical protein
MSFFARSVDGSDVKNLLPRRIVKTSPRQAHQAKHNQDQSNRLVHSTSAVSVTEVKGAPLTLDRSEQDAGGQRSGSYFSSTFSTWPIFF